jgi:Holliday junction DNA helicase RuvA
MYAYLKGKLVHCHPATAVVDVNGIGFEISISLNTYSSIQNLKEVQLFTHLQVREDAHVLYGFFDLEEKDIFHHLISVTGIGANTARTILSYIAPNELRNAIASGNVGAVKSVKGVGEKTAQRLILELRDKLVKAGGEISIFPAGEQNKHREDALNALVTLGFPKVKAEKAIDTLLRNAGGNISVEELVKLSLKNMG